MDSPQYACKPVFRKILEVTNDTTILWVTRTIQDRAWFNRPSPKTVSTGQDFSRLVGRDATTKAKAGDTFDQTLNIQWVSRCSSVPCTFCPEKRTAHGAATSAPLRCVRVVAAPAAAHEGRVP